jgi:FkbM family methyltransferase
MTSSIQQQIDDLLSESVEHATHREQAELGEILDRYSGRYVLFGAGNLGHRASTCLSRTERPPLAFSDNNTHLWGTCIDGLTVFPPEEAALRYGRDAAFFVTIWNDKHRFLDTQRQLEQLGCDFVFSGSPIYWRFTAEFLPNLCQDLPHKIFEHRDRVRLASTLWADRESETEFLAQLRWRALGDFTALREPTRDESYFPDGLFSLIPEEVFVDCGAFDGDTIRALARRTACNFAHVYAFEPDLLSFETLQRYLDKHRAISRKVTSFNLAVTAHRAKVSFDGSGRQAVAESGTATVDSVPLDDLAQHHHPTFIKMDIEGSELEALAGAARVIAHDRPILSICSYHKQSDLWEIPIRIAELCPNYSFFLKQHDPDAWQLVTYAVPAHRLSAN